MTYREYLKNKKEKEEKKTESEQTPSSRYSNLFASREQSKKQEQSINNERERLAFVATRKAARAKINAQNEDFASAKPRNEIDLVKGIVDDYTKTVDRENLERSAYLERYGYKDAVNVHDIFTDPEFSTVSKLERFELLNDKNKRRNAYREDATDYAAQTLKSANDTNARMRKNVADIDKNAEAIDKYYGAGTAEKMKQDLGMVAQSAWERSSGANKSKEYSQVIDAYGGEEKFRRAVEKETIGWNAGKEDPEGVEKRQARAKWDEDRIAEIDQEINNLDRATYDPTYSGYAENDSLNGIEEKKKALIAEKDELQADLAEYNVLQKKIDDGDRVAIAASKLSGEDPDDRYIQYVELSAELQRIKNLIDSGKETTTNVTQNGQVYKSTGDAYSDEEYITLDGEHTGMTYQEALEYYQAQLLQYERSLAPTDRYTGLLADYDNIVNSEEYNATKAMKNDVDRFLKLQKKGERADYNPGIDPNITGDMGYGGGYWEMSNPDTHGEDASLLTRGKTFYWDRFTEDELKIIRALWGTGRKNEAYQFISDMSPILGKRDLQASEEWLEKEASTLDKVFASVAGVAQRTVGGIPAFVEDVAMTAAGMDTNPYSYLHQAQNQGQAIEAQVAKDINEAMPNLNFFGLSAGQVYQGIQSGIDSGVSRALFGKGSVVAMAMGAASSEAKELWEKGATREQIAVGSSIAGIAEALFEYVSLEMAFKNFMESTPTSKMDFIKKALVQMGVEGSEEVATDLANLLGDAFNMNTQSEWAQYIKKYTDQGYSEAEAFGKAMWNDVISGKLWESFLGGALGTVFSTGGNFVQSLTGTYATGANIQRNGASDQLMEYANEVAQQSPRSTVQESLEKAQANPSRMNLGFLAMAVNQETVKQSEADINQALKDNGIDSKTAKKVRSAFMSMVNDSEYELTDEEQQLLEDERVWNAYNQVFGEEGAVTERNEAYRQAMTPQQQEDTVTPESVRDLLGPAGQAEFDEAVSKGYDSTDFVKAYLDGRMGTGAVTAQETLPAVKASNSTDTMTRLAYNAGRADAIGNNALNAVQNAVKAITPSQSQTKRGEALAEGAKKLVGTSTKGMYGRTVVSSNPGLIQDKSYKKAGISKNQGRLTNSIANALKIQVRFDENLTNDRGQRLNGHYDQNTATITLSTSVKNPAMAILGHEMVHRIRNVSEEAYDALRDYVIQAMSDDSMKWILGKRGELYNSKDSDFVTEEAVADAVGVLLGTSKNLQDRLTKEFATENRNVLQKILDVIRDIAYAIRTKLSGSRKTLTANQIAEFEDLQSNLAAMENAIVNALKQASESVETAQTEAEDNILGDTEDRHSIASLGEAMGFRLERENGLIVAYDRNNNRVNKVTPKHVQDSGIGALINLARVNGHISASDATKQIKAAAELMDMIIHSQDSELVWKFAGAAMFSAVKSNSDGQYTTTIDFSTVCRKTQEMITAMSEAMTRLGRGLTKDEVTELQKDILTEKGTVPCPVCYVFSRWAGIGGVLDNMNKWMLKYDHSWDEGTKLADRVKELKAIKEDLQLLRETLRAEDSQYLYLEGEVEAIDAQQKELAAKRREAVKLAKKTGDYSAVEEIDKAKERLAKARKSFKDELTKIESKGSPEAAWLEKVRMQPGYWEEGILDKKTGKISKKGQKILFNLDGAEEFSKSAPLSWAYRTSRGPGIGKAILPYSDMKLGDLILGPDKTRSTGNRTFEKVYGEFDTDQKFAIATAIKRTLAQNLIGGQRFQSTSDFRYDYGLDYLQVFWEAQALGSNMQTYTKIVEFGELAATIGGDVNLSVMPRDAGHKDGHLIFSSVTGIDVEAAAKLNAMFDNVQLILVGINDEHIRLALEDSEETGGNIIGFVIPYHASGASINKFISALVSNLGEDFNELNYKDYSKLQTDGEAEWAGESEIRLREIRQRLLTGKIGNKNWKPSQEELALIKGKNKNISKYSFDELRDIEKKALAGDKNAIKEYKSWSAGVLWDVYQKMWVNSSSKNTYGVRLSGTQAEHIMPHEYWNKSVDRAHAYINGFIFRSYCYNLGLTPRFTGISTDGREMGFGDFSDSTGYWKTLIDRPMYGNDGKYRDQQTLNVTNVSSEMLTPEYGEKQWGEFKVQEPSDVRAKKAADRFVKRVQARSAVRESIVSPEENERYMELAQNPEENEAELQRMVDEQAEASMPDSKVRGEDGKLLHVYHGTAFGGTIGVMGKGPTSNGYLWATSFHPEAENYSKWSRSGNNEGPGQVLPLYARAENPLVVDAGRTLPYSPEDFLPVNIGDHDAVIISYDLPRYWESAYEIPEGETSPDYYGLPAGTNLKEVYKQNNGKMYVIAVLRSNQFKRADPVTYDNEGNVIPLEERFNPNSNDIRESIDYRDTLDEMVKTYGKIPKGENPYREIELPKRTSESEKVSRVARSILESKVTPDAMVPTIEKMVADGELSFESITDKEVLEKARETVKDKGFADTLAKFVKSVERGIVNKQTTALGWALYDNAATAGDTQAALTVLRAMVAHQRTAAQALQASRILKKMSPEAQLYNMQKSLEDIIEEVKKRYGTDKEGYRKQKVDSIQINPLLAEQFLKARSDEERAVIYRQIYADIAQQLPTSFADRWTAWRYLCMLGNVKTHLRNFLGNALFAPIVLTKDAIATGLEAAVSKASKGKLNRTKSLGILTTDKGRQLYAAAWADYANVQELALGERKYNENGFNIREIDEQRKIFGNTRFKPWNVTGGWVLEKWRTISDKGLEKEDIWFNQPAYAYAMAQYCKAHGITPDQISKGKGLEAARQYGIKEAQKATYRDTNVLSEALSRLGRKSTKNKLASKAGSMIVEGILPFRKTPANILVRGLEYSPLGLLKSLTYDLGRVKSGEISGAEAIDNISAGLTGTMLTMLGVLMAHFGLVRGHIKKRDKEEDLESAQGHQRYSIEIGGYSYTIDWLAPESIPFFVGVNLYNAMTSGEKGMSMDEIIGVLSNTTEPILGLSCLSGLNDTIQTVAYSKQSGENVLISLPASAATSYLMQMFPTLGGQLDKTLEDKRYKTYPDKNQWLSAEVQRAIAQAANKVPIPGVEYAQVPYIDGWGREETTGAWWVRGLNNFLNPAYVQKINESEMDNELLRLSDVIDARDDRSSGVEVMPAQGTNKISVNNQDVYFTPEQYVQYNSALGAAAYETVGNIIASKEYKDLTDDEKISVIKAAYSYSQDVGRTAILMPANDNWTMEALEGEKKYNLPAWKFVLIRNKLNQASGKERSMDMWDIIYSTPGLTDSQKKYLLNCKSFNIGKKAREGK